MINYGFIYPQAILVFVITLLYSVVQPLILVFGAIYFGVAYVVYKYKLLFGVSFSFPSLSNLIIITFSVL
jgi:calcium permeable stress-gated cation channel